MSNSHFPLPSPMGVFRGYLPPLSSRTISRSRPSKTQGLVSNELMQAREYLPLLSFGSVSVISRAIVGPRYRPYLSKVGHTA